MLERGGGAMVNISSGAGELGLPYVAPYGAAKAGVNNLTKTFAGAWTPRGIPCELHRGRARRIGGIRARDGAHRPRSRQGRRRGQRGRARWAGPEEIANGILFLVSDAASFVSGETIYFGGGPKVAVPLALTPGDGLTH